MGAKASAARPAENGATTSQLLSVFRWLTIKEAEHYSRAAERKQLAKDAAASRKR